MSESMSSASPPGQSELVSDCRGASPSSHAPRPNAAWTRTNKTVVGCGTTAIPTSRAATKRGSGSAFVAPKLQLGGLRDGKDSLLPHPESGAELHVQPPRDLRRPRAAPPAGGCVSTRQARAGTVVAIPVPVVVTAAAVAVRVVRLRSERRTHLRRRAPARDAIVRPALDLVFGARLQPCERVTQPRHHLADRAPAAAVAVPHHPPVLPSCARTTTKQHGTKRAQLGLGRSHSAL